MQTPRGSSMPIAHRESAQNTVLPRAARAFVEHCAHRRTVGSLCLAAVLVFCVGASASERAESLPDIAPPVAVAVSIESNPRHGRDTYRIGETISVTVTFNEPVSVDEIVGTPSLALTVGDRERKAIYLNGSNTKDLVFRYRVADGDLDSDGVAVPADGLALDAGAKRDAADNPARLKTPAVPDQPGQRVDGQRPTPVPSQAISVAGSEVSIAFDEPLDEDSTPANRFLFRRRSRSHLFGAIRFGAGRLSLACPESCRSRCGDFCLRDLHGTGAPVGRLASRRSGKRGRQLRVRLVRGNPGFRGRGFADGPKSTSGRKAADRRDSREEGIAHTGRAQSEFPSAGGAPEAAGSARARSRYQDARRALS